MRDTKANLVAARTYASKQLTQAMTCVVDTSTSWFEELVAYVQAEHDMDVVPPLYLAHVNPAVNARVANKLPAATEWVNMVLIYGENQCVACLHYPVQEDGTWKAEMGIAVTTMFDDTEKALAFMELVNNPIIDKAHIALTGRYVTTVN